MSALVLVVLLLGALLYLAGGLVHLYRYCQARRWHPQVPRLWEEIRRRFIWRSALGVLFLAAFVAFAWWSAPGHSLPWLPNPFVASQGGGQPAGPAPASLPPAQVKVSGRVPQAPDTTTSTETTTSATTSSTTSTSTTTTLPPPPAKAAGGSREKAAWTVCAASFRKRAMAQSYARRLRKQGLPAKVSRVDLGSRGIWHRVCVGSFPSLAAARRQYKAWENKGLISDAFLLPLR